MMFIVFRFAFILALFVTVAGGQITQRNLLTGHFRFEDVKNSLVPRSNWYPYPQTAAEWHARVPQNLLDDIVKRGESALKKDVPAVPATLFLEFVRDGNRSRYEAQSFARRNNLMDLVLAESIEDKGRFSDAIANYVWAICEETYWGIPAHVGVQKAKSGLPDVTDPTVDLFGPETAATLALTDYLVGPKLDKISPLIRKRIYSEANRKIFEPIKDSRRYNWLDPTKKVNNWDPWISSNLIAAQLLLEPDETRRAENVYRYMQFVDIYLNGLGDDGGCDEGPSYWFAAGGAVFDALDMMNNATGGKVDIYSQPLIQNMASYIYKMHIAENYFVDFADADPKFSGDGLMLYRFGKALKNDTLSKFGQYLYGRNKIVTGEGFQKPRRISNLLSVKDMPTTKVEYTPERDAWFSDIQAMTARTPSGLFLASHAGNNDESHNHNDIGDFIVYLNNEPVIIDVGRGNYTAKTFSSHRYELWFTQSQYHNLPIVNGFGQLAGKPYTAEQVKHSTSDSASSLTMDIGKAYPKEAGIDYWRRWVSLDRTGGKVDILDDYSLTKTPASMQQVFMTVCDVDLTTPGKIKLTTPSGKTLFVSYDQNIWSATVEKPSMEGPEYSSFTTKWDHHSIQRILLTGRNLKMKSTFNYTVTVSGN